MSLWPEGLGRGEHFFLVRIPSASVEGSASGSASVKLLFCEMSKNRVSVHYLLNQLMDFNQTCTDTLIGREKEVIRIW